MNNPKFSSQPSNGLKEEKKAWSFIQERGYYLSEKSIPTQKQPIQSKRVHFRDTTLLEAESNPLFFMVKDFALTRFQAKKLNQKKNHYQSQVNSTNPDPKNQVPQKKLQTSTPTANGSSSFVSFFCFVLI